MDKILWTEDFSVGVIKLDEQHQKIIDLINTLIDHYNTPVESGAIIDVLKEMMSYAQQHLDYEEQLLEKNQYFDLINHAKGHVVYLEQVAQFSFDIMAHDEQSPQKLLTFLKQWWTQHILEEDMKYRAFFEEKGVK